MEIRFTLDQEFDAGLIARIEKRANGGSPNRAAKFLFRHWYESETTGFSPVIRQSTDGYSSIERQIGDDPEDKLLDALNKIDEEW